MRIIPLHKVPEHTRAIAKWLYDEWGHLRPGPFEERLAKFQACVSETEMPACLVAMEGDAPVGCVILKDHDMEHKNAYAPWLASLFVKPEFRNKGIALRLQKACLQKARELGFDRIYLYSPNKEEYYLKCGWNTVEHTEYLNRKVAIMAQETK
jgi:predicted N-acetyltransferase YhbS